MKNNHVTVLEINLNAIDFNLNFFRSKLNKSTKILAVVKAFGYGSDAAEVAKFLENKVDYFAVAYLDEGISLRKNGIKKPILVLHPQKKNLEKIIEYNLEPNIYSLNLLKSFLESAERKKLNKYKIHLKFNTGLNRLGFLKNDISNIIKLLNNRNEIEVTSIFSHIAASEDLDEREFTIKQIDSFKEISNILSKSLPNNPFQHILNTSGVINYSKEAQYDMVRIGIGLLGFGNDKNQTKNLKNVLTLKSVISQIHTIEKGNTVGYNRVYKAPKKIKTATVPIGHADGISRQLANGIGYVFVNDKKAEIIGNVCMDMIMIDVSEINCKEGDEVIIYKNQQHIENLAEKINTIPYEILTAISQRIGRSTSAI